MCVRVCVHPVFPNHDDVHFVDVFMQLNLKLPSKSSFPVSALPPKKTGILSFNNTIENFAHCF